MNVYISFDMEGITGVSHWNQVTSGHHEYPRYRAQLAREVIAACEGALAADAQRIVVKDAHDTGRNLDGSELPPGVELISGWSGHPLKMVQEIDENFAAALFIGYHTPAGLSGNALAHTFSSKKVATMFLNGQLASEYLICAHAAEMFAVPVVFVSGDEVLCAHVAEHAPACKTVSTMRGVGHSVVAQHPATIVEKTRSTVTEALRGDLNACRLDRPEQYKLEIGFHQPIEAYKFSFYPGAERVGEASVSFTTPEFFEVLRAIQFLA